MPNWDWHTAPKTQVAVEGCTSIWSKNLRRLRTEHLLYWTTDTSRLVVANQETKKAYSIGTY